jgi:hypothetical protein
MGFGGTINRLHKKLIPKELRGATPKEIQPGYASVKTDEYLGLGPQEVPPIPAAPPPESIDEDAYRQRDRQRRRARAGSTIRTSPQGASYSPAPARLLGG